MTPTNVAVILLCVGMILDGFTAAKPNGWVIALLGLVALLIQVGVLAHMFGH